ncbi:DNA cytosine methyltransferase [Lactiplantibacillus plantarum]|nr:DNA cytosine methyltransferase [Lactiplantibacillus plantarum]MCJ1648936.1 DNA cytosine methyltransferase [Lactiplantibacillus plantarum subsp. plantarum]MCT3281862.1 DNA cytosine methyltransferase [Lactiplantibacillus plantarum]MDI5784516.1 DNA cytosine methyltransferase [Lactiplantibacillus plantarum]UWF30055.1 DNA cytosine methyltransferase [Lactiplantibacillus plantarum]UWF40507.1 DNA cytosine methyltransferase [Lactiplantibacillus plantarum]
MKQMNIIDLFSGAGGLTEGFRSNFNIINHVEMDPAASKTLQLRDAFYFLKQQNKLEIYLKYLKNNISFKELLTHIPITIQEKTLNKKISAETILAIFDSIDKKIVEQNIFTIDGIIGGPPCQAYSTVGRARNSNKKNNDERIYLYRYYIEFIQKYHPHFFVFENVKGLLSFKDQFNEPLLPKMIQEFKNAGYRLQYQLIDSSMYGVPQKRERLIIFGTDGTIAPELFFKQLETKKENSITIGQLFQDLPFLHSGETVNSYGQTIPNAFVNRHIRSNNDIPLTQNVARPNQPNDLLIYRQAAIDKSQGHNFRYDELDPSQQTHKNRKEFLDRYKVLDKDSVSHTVVAHISKDGHYYIHPDVTQNRSITVREAARIQTFPDDFYFETSRTHAFTQIGNAVPPYLAKKIASTIIDLYN